MLCYSFVNKLNVCNLVIRSNVYIRHLSGNGNPAAVYKKRLVTEELKPDTHQQNVIKLLDKLYYDLEKYVPAKPAESSGFSFFSFKKKADAKDKLRGLYIYGCVGGGKTTLMDLFFDCCKVTYI